MTWKKILRLALLLDYCCCTPWSISGTKSFSCGLEKRRGRKRRKNLVLTLEVTLTKNKRTRRGRQERRRRRRTRTERTCFASRVGCREEASRDWRGGAPRTEDCTYSQDSKTSPASSSREEGKVNLSPPALLLLICTLLSPFSSLLYYVFTWFLRCSLQSLPLSSCISVLPLFSSSSGRTRQESIVFWAEPFSLLTEQERCCNWRITPAQGPPLSVWVTLPILSCLVLLGFLL